MAQRQHEFYQLAEGGTYIQTAAKDTLYIHTQDFEELEFISDRKKLVLRSDVDTVYWQDAKQSGATIYTLTKGSEQTVLLDYGKTGSTIAIPLLDDGVWSMLKATPAAFINATFRPFPWNIRSPFMALSGLENILLVGLLALVIFFFQPQALSHPIFYVSISFALIILVLTGLVTPVVGAIVRYKVPALPFLACGLLALVNTARIETYVMSKFPVLKKYF